MNPLFVMEGVFVGSESEGEEGKGETREKVKRVVMTTMMQCHGGNSSGKRKDQSRLTLRLYWWRRWVPPRLADVREG